MLSIIAIILAGYDYPRGERQSQPRTHRRRTAIPMSESATNPIVAGSGAAVRMFALVVLALKTTLLALSITRAPQAVSRVPYAAYAAPVCSAGAKEVARFHVSKAELSMAMPLVV